MKQPKMTDFLQGVYKKYQLTIKYVMAHNFGLEAPICISKDSFEILRLSALIWAQTETLYAETGEKIVFEVYQWQFFSFCINNQSFWAVSISKLLSWFLTYLR